MTEVSENTSGAHRSASPEVIGIVGAGATGAETARRLAALRPDAQLELFDVAPDRAVRVAAGIGRVARVVTTPFGHRWSVAILAAAVGDHVAAAKRLLADGVHVVSVTDDLGEVDELLDLDDLARSSNRSLVIGAGFAPGFTCLLARHAGNALDEVVEIAVAKSGTGGPACARQHHRAMKRDGQDWMDGAWESRRGGSGRDLAWFPEPIGARDSYRAELPSPRLLQRVYPGAERISARVTATRRDRFTSPLPMLRPPHADGGPGAVRIEVRGLRDGAFETIIFGVMAHPSAAAGAVAAASADQILHPDRGAPTGAWGLAEWDRGHAVLRALHELGLRAVTFEGLGVV